jgi:hypothetical protein
MEPEQYENIVLLLQEIANNTNDLIQMIKATALTQIELPNGSDANLILEQININYEGI